MIYFENFGSRIGSEFSTMVVPGENIMYEWEGQAYQIGFKRL